MKSSLNLARVWRSRNFDEIAGQELAVRLVKNSLYRDQLFPVYLLAGQRGCGKTTLARVFAAAINCSQRENFTKNPKETLLPCLTCPSCEAMKNGSHPDFHEIDAASHTGVDNVRSLIDAATFLPGLGRKKIYLIDEAHMLSKAAFNAFLKIMEEPPATVTFMLATTDPHKIIETVRSRCFQLFLRPLPPKLLHDHLASICAKENMSYESEALLLIAQESEGSVRDALNRLEQIYLANGSITYKDTLAILGDISFEQLINVCDIALRGDQATLIQTLETINLKQYSASQIWKKTVDLLRELIWIKQGICSATFEPHKEQLTALAQTIHTSTLIKTLEMWYQTEPLFNKTQVQEILLESLFIRMLPEISAQTEDPKNPAAKPTAPSHKPTAQASPTAHTSYTPRTQQTTPLQNVVPTTITEVPLAGPKTTHAESPTIAAEQPAQEQPVQEVSQQKESTPWNNFLTTLVSKDDPLVLSIFKQAIFLKHESSIITLQFDEQHIFFKDLVEQTKSLWLPLIQEIFGATTTITLAFTAQKKTTAVKPQTEAQQLKPIQVIPIQVAPVQAAHPFTRQQQTAQQPSHQTTTVTHRLDVRDREHWKQVHTVLDIFPGTVTEEKENVHE